MPHSYNKIWVHTVWGTKLRKPLIISQIESTVFNLMREELRNMGCPVRIVNGMPDHVHCLFLLNPKMAITDIVKQVKGGSSHSINQGKLMVEKFAWQSGFGAFSVSESAVEKVYRYILTQKEHHKKQTFLDEYKAFLQLHGMLGDFVEDNV